ncbi:MAG: choice-of-anchor Q domain-containing protein, partial [Bacteroidota bacterium]
RVVGLVSLGDPARERVFYINQDGVKLYGGFSGQETSREQRNPDLYPTILDGNRGDVNLTTDNCYRVLYLDGTTANGVLTAATVIDGFTIQNGNADFFGANGGAGMYIEGNASQTATAPLINNCKFANNNVSFAGAGIYLAGFNGNCSPTISDCVFESNTSDLFGAAIHFDAADGRTAPSIEACIFKQNTATLGGGAINIGGFGMSDLTTQIVNCVFDQNGANHIRYSEGTMNQQPTFTNCTFNGASTQAIDISVYENSNSPIHFLNCIFWNNNALTDDDTAIAPQNCIVGNDTNNTFAGSDGNINQNPLFVDAANGDLSLQASSPAVESGTNSAVSGIAGDIDGNARIIGCSVDIGAYEFQNPQVTPSIIYVDQNVIGSNKDGTSWANAFTDLQDAIDAFSTNCNTEIWVAQGIYKPTKDNPAS